MSDERFEVSVEADTQHFEQALANLEKQAGSFGTTLTGAMKSAIISGKSLQDTLRSIALSFSNSALNAGLAPLQNMLNGFGGSLAKILPFAKGGLTGGVVNSPTYFPNGQTIGLMGEAGTEAILPLKRGADGRLGVASHGNQAGRPVNITVNIATPDIHGFQRSSSQLSAALTRAVVRGQRSN